jgi:hypothetical protein
MHQIQSTSVPSGAANFGPSAVGSEPSFSYTVTVAGQYNYQCNFHFSSGMVGSFTATEASDVSPIPANVIEVQNFPNPSIGKTMIHYTLTKPSQVDLRLYDLSGKEQYHTSEGFQSEGMHMIFIDAGTLPSGSYTYELKTGEAILTREMIILK